MWQPEKNITKLYILGGVIAVTLGIHYGLIIEPIFGHVHWLHVVHGRFCYIPIVIAAAWFGLRGGLYTALFISIAILPYIFSNSIETHSLADELSEIVFYFAIALLTGGLVQREFRSRKRAEDMKIQLERSQKMSLVGQIAAGMAHEIKNPLASIKGAVEILCEDKTTSGDREEFKAIVVKEVQRINTSVTDFLEFARPSEAKLQQLDLALTLKSSLRQIEAQARKRNITIKSKVADRVLILGDEEKIHQVILNLVLNALDASPNVSNVNVNLNSGSGKATITIEDSGPGISEENADKVFEPFFTTKSSGTGLGLAIARNIVERHEGEIRLRSSRHGGAVAEIEFPLYREGGAG